jgi:hypothetical protein
MLDVSRDASDVAMSQVRPTESKKSSLGICTCLYEAGRRFIHPYADGAIVAAGRVPESEVVFLFAIDDISDPVELLRPLSDFGIERTVAGSGGSITAVRNALFDLGRRSDVDHLVFVDLDDVLLPDALLLHSQALSRTDISFGDLRLMDAEGTLSSRCMFDDRQFPDVISGSDILLHQNFMGLSNTAIRRSSLGADIQVPEHLVSTDWWLFTNLLDHGLTASRAAGPVVGYRQHGANVLGGGEAITVSGLKRRCRIAFEHFGALPPTPERHEAQAVAARLQLWLESASTEEAEAMIRRYMPESGLWFEEVFAVGSAIGEVMN